MSFIVLEHHKLYRAVKKLFSAAKHARILGMTATYLRSDGVDPAVEIFGSHNLTDVYTYTDAVREGIMPKMIYYNAKYYRLKNADGSYIKAIDTYNEEALKVLINDALSKDIAEDNLLHNFGDNIRDSIINSFGEAALARSQRWLCLFPTISTLQLKKQEVYASFKRAFPDKTVKLLEVHGQDSTARSNLKLLYQSYDANGNKIYNEWLTPKQDECVVILACRMLNMGYHAGVFTGEVLYGATSSNIVYQQQLGRTLDIMRNTEPIIIDLADAFGTIRLDASIHAAVPKRDKKSKTDKADTKTIDKDKEYYTNAVTDECLILGTTQKAEIDLEIKLEEFRCKDYIRIIVDGVINGTIKDQKTLLFFARRYHVLPKYVYNTLKKAALAGKIDIIKTTIGTFGGVKRIENVTQTVSISPEHVKIIDEPFKGIATI